MNCWVGVHYIKPYTLTNQLLIWVLSTSISATVTSRWWPFSTSNPYKHKLINQLLIGHSALQKPYTINKSTNCWLGIQHFKPPYSTAHHQIVLRVQECFKWQPKWIDANQHDNRKEHPLVGSCRRLVLDLLDPCAEIGHISQVTRRQGRNGIRVRYGLQGLLVQLVHKRYTWTQKNVRRTKKTKKFFFFV